MKRKLFPLSPILGFALAHAALGCEGTEGPLLVRSHLGGAGGGGGGSNAAGSSGSSGTAGGFTGGAAGNNGSSGTVTSSIARNRPASNVTWQVQLSGSFDASVDVELYYVELDNLTSAELSALTNSERHVACYLSAGTYEPWRADASSFPEEVLGNVVTDYPNERWLDIRSSVVVSLMQARIERMLVAGCSSVVIANVTSSGEDSGFELSAADPMNYLIGLSRQLHQRGLLVGLATAEERLGELEPYFDWAFAQECWLDQRCSAYAPFIAASKAVLAVEFGDRTTSATLCQGIAGSGINLLIKPRDLGAGRIACLP